MSNKLTINNVLNKLLRNTGYFSRTNKSPLYIIIPLATGKYVRLKNFTHFVVLRYSAILIQVGEREGEGESSDVICN